LPHGKGTGCGAEQRVRVWQWDSFTQTGQSLRGGMVYRNYIIRFKEKTIRAWTYEMPDGKLEQFQVAVAN